MKRSSGRPPPGGAARVACAGVGRRARNLRSGASRCCAGTAHKRRSATAQVITLDRKEAVAGPKAISREPSHPEESAVDALRCVHRPLAPQKGNAASDGEEALDDAGGAGLVRLGVIQALGEVTARQIVDVRRDLLELELEAEPLPQLLGG